MPMVVGLGSRRNAEVIPQFTQTGGSFRNELEAAGDAAVYCR